MVLPFPVLFDVESSEAVDAPAGAPYRYLIDSKMGECFSDIDKSPHGPQLIAYILELHYPTMEQLRKSINRCLIRYHS